MGDLSIPELITFAAVLLGCLVWAPFVARHWRGTYDRIEVGFESLPFNLSQRTKDRMMANYDFVVIGVGTMAAATLLDTARPRVPVLPKLLGAVFFAWGRQITMKARAARRHPGATPRPAERWIQA